MTDISYSYSTTSATGSWTWNSNTANSYYPNAYTLISKDETLNLALKKCKELESSLKAERTKVFELTEENTRLKRIIDENEWKDLMGNVS